MRKVQISGSVRDKIVELEAYLVDELKLSQEAALRRSGQMRKYIRAFNNAVDYPLCRFKKWRELGYRCAVFEKNWVFAYEIIGEGIIVRDMSHTSLLID